ncbi:hypothetical protein KI387_032366, partial [Taxus chinensis]
ARRELPFYKKDGEYTSVLERSSMCIQGSWLTIFNTCLDLEGAYLEYLQRITGRPMLPVGILMPTILPRPAAERSLAWLDRQAPRSVVFVSFGSESTLTSEELGELALGLEDSQVSFLCVLLRDMAAGLPQGFANRMQGKGFLVTEWAPQMHVLSHSSTGAFLTHCGWNSVTEGL